MELQNVKIADLTFSHIIRLIREVAVVGVCSYFAIKVFSGDLSLDFTKLSASELVSILLAFFSIVLSAAFYFAASDSSAKFYNNINTFNKDMSELVGRLDEQVKNVNVRQKEIVDNINKAYGNSELGSDSTPVVDASQEIQELSLSWQKTLDDIFNRASMTPKEREKLELEINQKNDEISRLKSIEAESKAKLKVRVNQYIARRIRRMDREYVLRTSPEQLLGEFSVSGSEKLREDMKNLGFIKLDADGELRDITKDGIDAIVNIVDMYVVEAV